MREEGSLRRTHLHGWHVERAHMTSFSGFEMPVGVGVFDVTHMGRFEVSGADSRDFLEYATSRRLTGLSGGSCRYGLLLNENGGILDDVMINYFDEEKTLLVVNAGNREKDFRWLLKNSEGYRVSINDVSDATPMFAVQG
ncbi:MAG: glycine cleavage system aminomethyltransferase GcvT, partial [Candidatus Freyarchaeota archaeon]